MEYKILASDYDNTLVPFGEKRPRPAVVEAIERMQKAGGSFVLSTGRAWAALQAPGQLGGIHLDYAITCSGALVTDSKGKVLAESALTAEEMYALVDFCEDYDYLLQFDFSDACYAYCGYEALHDMYAKLGSPGLDCLDGEDQDRHLTGMPHAAFLVCPDAAAKAFQKKYAHLNLNFMQVGAANANVKGWCSYDVVRGGVDKGVGLARLCEALDIPIAAAVATGDSAYDCAMLRAAGLGCCMANGSPDAKESADRIIPDVREDGVAALIDELWFGGVKAVPSGRDLGSPWAVLEEDA